MRKLKLLFTSLCVATGAMAQLASDPYYQTHLTDLTVTHNNTRHIDAIKLTGNSDISTTTNGRRLYRSFLGWGEGFTASAGDEVTTSMDWSGQWMHGYVYLDRGNDGTFTSALNDGGTPAEGSDVVSFTHYNGKNSVGTTTANDSGVGDNFPAFTLPSTPGFYRMRYKVDWNDINAKSGNTSFTTHCGQYVDVRLHVKGANSNLSAETTYCSVTNEDGSALSTVANGVEHTIKITPGAGYDFLTMKVRYGYNLDNDDATPFLDDMVYWKEVTVAKESLSASEDGTYYTYDIPSTYTQYDVEVIVECDRAGFTDFYLFKNGLQDMVDTWRQNQSDNALFYPNTAKVAAMQAQLDAANPTTAEQAEEMTASLTETITKANVLNIPVTGKYRFKNVARNEANGHYMAAATQHNAKSILANDADAEATRAIWNVTITDGTCTIQNYLTNEYLQSPSKSKQVKMTSTPTTFTIYPAEDDKWGTATFGTGGTYEKLHLDGSLNIVGWETGNATNFSLIAVDDSELATATTAENALTANATENIRSTASALGITPPSFNTLNDYMEGSFAYVFEPIINNVYRIVTAGASEHPNKALGVYKDDTNKYSAGVPAGVSNPDIDKADNKSTDPGLLWRFEPNDNGIKLVNLNREAAGLNATIRQAVPEGIDPTPFTTLANGCVYWITEVSDGVVRFKYGSNDHDALNMETDERHNHLSRWGGDNAQFAIHKIEEVDITLNGPVDGKYWASSYLPFGVSEASENVELLTGVIGAEVVTMTAHDNVAKENGFLVRSTSGSTATLTVDNSATEVSEIGGSTEPTVVNDDNRTSIYVFGKGGTNNKVGFYNLSANRTVAANRAYIDNLGANSRGFVISFDEIETSIDNIDDTEGTEDGSASIYDLSGRRVNKATKGIYIMNGKKVIR